ncbi:MAG: hypothetical protein LBQ56_04970 [Synergistaceae bacterium]|nr:hypothetical protein [Synergistaceae bacterium]
MTYIEPHDGGFILATESTPFHPRDYRWPDQPEDKGYLENSLGRRYDLSDVVFMGRSPDGAVYVAEAIPVRKGEPGWHFFVGHVVREDRPDFEVGDGVILQVDRSIRWRLSRAHSAAHVMSYALNESFSRRWRREVSTLDGMGNPNFDAIAAEMSSIDLLSCSDRYRLGKTMRKKGFSTDGLSDDITAHEREINALVGEWMRRDAPVTIRAEEDGLVSERYWRTTLNGVEVEMPCGGTHVSRLSEIGGIRVGLEMPDDETLIITTNVR